MQKATFKPAPNRDMHPEARAAKFGGQSVTVLEELPQYSDAELLFYVEVETGERFLVLDSELTHRFGVL
jgi:hypothetical protein